ncbi:MAG TPA: protein kinase [Thermoanaerobaculia bacterium]|nr:protein kinase [Thermoanaerobaculia bacterium]
MIEGVSDDTARPKPRRRLRPRFPLVLKIFLLTALLIALVVGASIGVTVRRANFIAQQTVNQAIAGAGSLFEYLEQRRLKDLSLGAITLSNDPPFHAYIEEALNPVVDGAPDDEGAEAASEPVAPVIDTASIVSQLVQRRELLGSDLLILTDDEGITLGRTDEADVTGARREDLYEQQPILRRLIDEPPPADESTGVIEPVTGAIMTRGKLYHAAVVPLSLGGRPPIGYLFNAHAIDDAFANQIANATSTGVAFIPAGADAGAVTARSTNAPSAENMKNMAEVTELLTTGRMIPAHAVRIDQSAYVTTGEPLAFQEGATPAGAALFVRSLDSELAPFKEIERTLVVAGAIALLVAFLLSWLIAKRLTRPIEQLADVAQAVTDGDYSVRPDIRRSDEIGMLSRAFSSMISALGDKAELEELYEAMAARVAEREALPAPRASQPARAEEGTILVTDLRGAPAGSTSGEPAEVLARVAEAMKVQEIEILRHDGHVREIEGHRLVSTFTGERAIVHAIRAARAISEELALRSSGEAVLGVGVGIASGDFVTGSVELMDESGMAMIGNAPLLALLFAWEAPTGSAFVSVETAQAAPAEVMAAATREEVRLRWLPAPLTVMALPLQSLTTGVMQAMQAGTSPETVRIPSGATMPAAATADLAPGALFANRYEIEQVIGRGGMGTVYRALDRQLDETVAIKTLTTEVLRSSPEQLERFKREIRLARKITHRNVLRTYDYGEAEGVYFISMEYIRGYSLADLLEETPRLAPRVATGISRQICRGLQAAHEQGIIHRDIKPQNVLIDHRGEVKLMDFGIARMAEAPEAMTQAGFIVGTPHYMSPEQVQGKQLDARSDIYSMGVLIYQMLCGRPPFDAPALTAVLMAHLSETPKPPIALRPDIGAWLNELVLRCLAKEAKDRYTNAEELLQELDVRQAA